MKFGKWLAVVLFWLGCGVAARAQAGIYFGYSATKFSGVQCLDTIRCSNGTATSATGSVNPSGLFIGGYYDVRNVGPVRLGVDVRYMDDRSNKSASSSTGGKNSTSANSILAGVRGSVKTPISWLKPYGVISVGRTNSDVADGTGAAYLNFLQYEFFAGADVRILPHLDLRPVELGIGNMNRLGTGTGTSSVGVKSIGAGVVLHFP
jgi:hypothetical protein